MKGVAAVASDPDAAAAARAVLDAGHGAVDAVVAGFFAAAGKDAAVLLAPTSALVVGQGVGARAFDGRAAQPGRGAPRPRGFLRDGEIPDAARVAAPRTIQMLALLHAYRGRASFAELARAGVASARVAGALARAALIQRVGAQGVLALRADQVARPLLGAAGSIAGGALSAADLQESVPADVEARSAEVEGGSVYSLPWSPEADGPSTAGVVLAADARGLIAMIAYAPSKRSVSVPDLEISIGGDAIPVRRGVTRMAPGTPLFAAAPIAAVGIGTRVIAVALPGRTALANEELRCFAGPLLVREALAELCSKKAIRGGLGLLWDGRAASSISAD